VVVHRRYYGLASLYIYRLQITRYFSRNCANLPSITPKKQNMPKGPKKKTWLHNKSARSNSRTVASGFGVRGCQLLGFFSKQEFAPRGQRSSSRRSGRHSDSARLLRWKDFLKKKYFFCAQVLLVLVFLWHFERLGCQA